MRRALMALLAGGAVTLTGCSATPPPEITFFADGETATAVPLMYCDALVRSCEPIGDAATLKVRPGKPVQISVPSEIAETPWLVNVQYLNADGEVQPVKQEVFTTGDRLAYTITPDSPDDQLVVVEIQQLSGAYAANQQDEPLLDESGQPQLVVRGVWSLQIDPVEA
ncbi:DUF2771 family protein [Saccharomonospora sp. NPDC006951]